MQAIQNIMTIPEMIKALQGLQQQETPNKQFFFYVEGIEKAQHANDETLTLTQKQIADIEISRQQARKGQFVPKEEMDNFFLKAQTLFKQAIESQKDAR